MPTIVTFGNSARRATSSASASGSMPNWLPAVRRGSTRTCFPCAAAAAQMSSKCSVLSAVSRSAPSATARATSPAPLFTPEYRMRSGGMPSFSQIVSSPGEHTSTQRNTSGRPRSTKGLAFME